MGKNTELYQVGQSQSQDSKARLTKKSVRWFSHIKVSGPCLVTISILLYKALRTKKCLLVSDHHTHMKSRVDLVSIQILEFIRNDGPT